MVEPFGEIFNRRQIEYEAVWQVLIPDAHLKQSSISAEHERATIGDGETEFVGWALDYV